MIKLATYLLRRQALLWVILLISGGLNVWTMLYSTASIQQAVQTQEKVAQIQATLVSVLNLETGIRGYSLTGVPAFLEPYTAARNQMDAQLDAMRRSQSEHPDRDTPSQLGRINRIERLLDRWYVDVGEYAIRFRLPSLERVIARAKSGIGKRLIDAVRLEISAYEKSETAQLQAQQTQTAAARQLNERVTLGGLLTAILVSIVSSLSLARHLGRMLHRFADAAETLALTEHAALPVNVRIQEVGRLALSFNQMSAQLSESHGRLVMQNAVLQDRNMEVSASNALATQLQSCLEVSEGLTVLERALPQLFPERSGTLSLLNASRNLLEVKVQWGPVLPHSKTALPSSCLAVRQGHPHELDQPFGLPCPLQGEAHLCLPLLAQGEALGYLRLTGVPQDVAAQTRERALAVTVANQSALGLSNLRLRESLRQQSIRDPLTGLFNRRYLAETFEREVMRTLRHDQPLSLLMFDVDHFKRFNDEFGHDAGDQVLTSVGTLLRAHFRTEDIVCRYGGEEFAVVMPETALPNALERAESLRQAVSSLTVMYGGTHLGTVRVSIGVSAAPKHGTDSATLLTLADHALYQAKQNGRNQVVAAPDPEDPQLSVLPRR